MKRNEGKELITKYLNGTASKQEEHLVNLWYANKVISNIDQQPQQEDFQRIKEEMWASIVIAEPRKTISIAFWVRCVAAVLLAVLFVGIYQSRDFFIRQQQRVSYTADISPAKQGATLILSNGSKISLSEASIGELAETEGVSVFKAADGQLVYSTSKNDDKTPGKINTLITSKGEVYNIVLPDGSKVWLNAASKISFNSHLASAVTRTVKLEGEAYFEVAKKKNRFVVETGDQKVQVLGTHFNINGYKEQGKIETTLLEGSVKIFSSNGSGYLKPGEQAVEVRGGIQIGKVDVETVIAWKNGYFKFDESLGGIMDQLARWYDVELIYEDDAPKNVKLWGYISRDKKLTAVLHQLSRTNKVHFKLEGRKLYVINP